MSLVLFDSYVFVRSLLDPWAPYGSLRELPDLPGPYVVRVSSTVADEAIHMLLGGTTLRGKLPSIAGVSAKQAYPLLTEGILRAATEEVEIEACADPRANTLLAEALVLEADYLVTGNPELVDLDGSPDWQQFKDDNQVRLRIMDAGSFLSHVMESA